ncbi:hypothetical protein M2163_006822 [Streptomyces sp. SAI-135]|uniref:hypothetical protein n=1 Tax=Streptomyces TaxID=1883 RepID=UPI0024744F95|nr:MULTISPECIES: hypothetical protein [unclassified Streptomyces]MDH6516196.1 hypothetical protein [Streptomyces sp. SAI-090]MDH6619714.1 hypothetical protein [Streptomyces sp. SAI-135]
MQIESKLTLVERRPRGNLAEKLSRISKEDGEHVVFEDDGRKLVVEVVQGRAVDWKAYDVDGSEVATVVVRQPSGGPPGVVAAMPGARWAIVCACFASGDFCWWQPY